MAGRHLEHNGWNYIGDVNIRHGGFYWRDEENASHRVDIVQVVPWRDAGCPDNLFQIKVGVIDLSREDLLSEALRISDRSIEPSADRGACVDAMLGAFGLDDLGEDWTLRIGKHDETWSGVCESPDPLDVLRAGTSLRKWIEREYLYPIPAPTHQVAASPRM